MHLYVDIGDASSSLRGSTSSYSNNNNIIYIFHCNNRLCQCLPQAVHLTIEEYFLVHQKQNCSSLYCLKFIQLLIFLTLCCRFFFFFFFYKEIGCCRLTHRRGAHRKFFIPSYFEIKIIGNFFIPYFEIKIIGNFLSLILKSKS